MKALKKILGVLILMTLFYGPIVGLVISKGGGSFVVVLAAMAMATAAGGVVIGAIFLAVWLLED